VQARAGIIETTGLPDGLPVPVPLPIVEFMTGTYAAAAVVAALRVKRASGIGQRIDMALYDCAFSAMATFLPRILAGINDPIVRAGNRHAMIAPWNVYQARDGWILICVGSDQQWQRLCAIMAQPGLESAPHFSHTPDRLAHVGAVDSVVQTWVGGMTVAGCVAALNAAQIASGPIVRIDGHPREANLDHRGMIRSLADPATGATLFVPGSPLRMSAAGGRIPDRVPTPDEHRSEIERLLKARTAISAVTPHAAPKASLAGIRVIEIGHYTTVPLSTRMLASLGAEVIKIEPPEGEATRDWPPTQRGQGYFFTTMNSDKQSLTLDLRDDADAARLRELIKTADVLIENLKPGALARRGFGWAEISALNPRLISCSVSGFGVDSLYAGRPAYDSVIQAMSGLMDLVRAGNVPLKTGISSADLMGAEMALLAVLAALAYRDRSGRGQCVDLSMQDIAAWLTQTAWNGGAAADGAPGLLACSDGYVVYDRESGRQTPHDESLRSGAQPTRNAAAERLTENGVACAPVLTVHEMMAEAQTAARALWFNVETNGEVWPLLASPLRLLGTPPAVRRPMPALGHDNERILRALKA
jgi:crotonobetainyl-CoA:carnitine CoA-transferase CaiB-like acyl-CoA transferase